MDDEDDLFDSEGARIKLKSDYPRFTCSLPLEKIFLNDFNDLVS